MFSSPCLNHPAEALAIYRCQAALTLLFGIEPTAETQSLYWEIKSGVSANGMPIDIR